MTMILRGAMISLLVAACDAGDGDQAPPPPQIEQPQPAKTDWQIGPAGEGGYSYSKNCPLHPTDNGDGSFSFFIGPCEPHYVTGRTAGLAGKKTIRARFRLEGPADAVISGAKCGASSRITLFFSTNSLEGRWWAKGFGSSKALTPNMELELVADLNDPRWGPVAKTNAGLSPELFAKDRATADRAGFTFSNCEGYGHGAQATASVRFTVLEFMVL